MANKEALRELQGRLAERLQAARDVDRPAGWLAVESGGHGFLFPLAEAGEIFQGAGVMPVPHSRAWFLGVANLRGTLAGVVDLAGFLGLRDQVPTPARDQGQLVAFNPALDINSAFLVDRLAGLRNQDQLVVEPGVEGMHPAYVGRCLRDESGRVWQELRLSVLARDERFLQITTLS
jgi:twitching motility protein PilI